MLPGVLFLQHGGAATRTATRGQRGRADREGLEREGYKMAIRNMVNVAKSTENKIPVWYQLPLEELATLYKMEKLDAATMAFHYGFALALRMAKRDAQKARTAQEATGRARR